MKSLCILFIMALVFENVQSRIHHHRHYKAVDNKITLSTDKPMRIAEKLLPAITATTILPSAYHRHYDGRTVCDDEEETVKWSTIIMPKHIDRNSFRVTPPDPYYTVGPVQPIGYIPPHHDISSCEVLYKKHMRDVVLDSEQTPDVTQESLEIMRLPVNPNARQSHEY